MSFREAFGRCLIVILCVLSGVHQLESPQRDAKSLSDCYSKNFAKLKEYKITLPVTPQILSTYSVEIIYLTGVLLLLGSILTIINSKLGPFLLSLLLLSFNLVIHNPLIYSIDKEFLEHIEMCLLNFGMIAGLVLSIQGRKEIKKKVD